MQFHKLYEIANQFDMHREVAIFKDAVAFMEQKFKKYWEHIPPLYCFAAVLDPRMKLGGLDSLMKGIAKKLQIQLTMSSNEVQDGMARMFDEYNHRFGQGHGSTSRATSSVNVASSSSASWKTVRSTPRFSYTSSSSSSRSELENYFETNFSVFFIASDGEIIEDNFDLLTFWKGQSTTFPVLSRMARDILTIPVSTVASEQVFSQSGRVLEERRARLSEDILEAQMCIKDWEDARRRKQQFVDDMLNDFKDLGLSQTGSTTTI